LSEWPASSTEALDPVAAGGDQRRVGTGEFVFRAADSRDALVARNLVDLDKAATGELAEFRTEFMMSLTETRR
jgi:hypothetical protein